MIKENFINHLIKTLKKNKCQHIPFIASIFEQQMDKVPLLLYKLKYYDYYIDYEPDTTSGYTVGKVYIHFTNGNSASYMFEILYDDRWYGYCMCNEKDEDYHPKYKCCGKDCDWTAPSFRVYELKYINYYSWEGEEREYWKTKEKMEELMNEIKD